MINLLPVHEKQFNWFQNTIIMTMIVVYNIMVDFTENVACIFFIIQQNWTYVALCL